MKLKNELPVIVIILTPFLYLAYIWNQLPERVPIHWNIHGQIDRYGDKLELLLIPIFLPLLVYLIFLLTPIIDPKRKIDMMGRKYRSLKLLMSTFMSVLAIYIIYAVKNQSLENQNFILLILGVLYIIIGNYFKTIRANYFIGIRTPWTLENETVWRDTHRMAGVLWFIAGFVVVVATLLLNREHGMIFFMIITGIITLVPVIYSYLRYSRLKS